MNPKWLFLLFLKTLVISENHGCKDCYSFQCMNKNITRNQITDNCLCITSNEIKTTKSLKCKCVSDGTNRNVWMDFVCTRSSSTASKLNTILLENTKSTIEVYLNRSCISLIFSKGLLKYRIKLFCRGNGLGVKCKCNVPVDNELGHTVSSKDLSLSDNGNQDSPLMSWNDRDKRDVDDVVNTTQISVENTSAQNNKMTTKLTTSILSKGSTETDTIASTTQTSKQGRTVTLSHLTATTGQYITITDNKLTVTSHKAQASQHNTIHTITNHQVLSTESYFTSETENTTKQIGAALPKNKKGGSPAAIAVGVVVPILILTLIGVVVYKWYRRKYPVRMVLGKNFSKFQNPVYNKKTSTLSLVRSVPYDAPYSGGEQDGGHDNPSLDMEYRDLQPVNFSTSYENAESLTEINEVPKKPPRSKKRISVMSTESTDSRVMSAFLQEALSEADSESENTNESNKTKKKISVDVDMRKNISRVSVESVESENDLHTSDDESNDERTYENITISSKKGKENSVPDQSYVETKSRDDEENYEEMETIKTEKKLSDENDEYDIVTVDESDTNNATKIIVETTDQVDNSDNSDADYENFEMRSENNEIIEEGIDIEGIQLDEIDGKEIHGSFDEGGKKKKVKVTFEENEILGSDEESIASINSSDVKDENFVETHSNNSGIRRSENNENDFVETKKVIKVSEMPSLLQALAKSESRAVVMASANKEKRTIASDQLDVHEKIAVNQNKSRIFSDDSESEKDTDSHKSDEFTKINDTGIDQTYLHTQEDSREPIVKSVSTSDSSENGSMDEFENLNNMNETIGQHGNKENDNKELTSIPPLPNIQPPDLQNFQSMISSDFVMTETPIDVADASSGDESASFSNGRQEHINADSTFEATSIPPLPLTKPPPTFEQNSNDSYNVFEDHSISNVDSDSENKSDMSENHPTPPIPASPPPIFQQNQTEFPYDSFTVMTKPGGIHTEDQSQNKQLGSSMDDMDDEYDVLTNDDLISVSSDPDELMHESYVTNTSANPQLITNIEELPEESDVGSDVISISDTNSEPGEYEKQTDTALSSSAVNAEVEQRFSKVISSPKINFYDAETNTKVIASPKINFDDTDSYNEKSDTDSESSV
ncbi:dentin sialophosphoprotein-like [Mytilus californianus]|uniref:dentin sialophosphoprotein-like n=1 Tax=Mytilus californianus TaxID=6549 RepID=UPI00224539DC|nr:dentin sialophosphoprotein-like [Mytilus californianus]